MESIKKNKVLLSIFFITLAIFVYFFFFRGSGTGDISISDLTTSVAPGDSAVLNKIDQLNSVHIDQSLFTSAAWLSLKDIGTPLPSDTAGKSDIFGSLGSR